MGNEQPNFDERTVTGWFFAIALLVVVALVAAFLILGVAGIGLVMVAVTPIMYILLVTISVGG